VEALFQMYRYRQGGLGTCGECGIDVTSELEYISIY